MPKSENRPIAEGIVGDDISFSRDYIQEKHWSLYTGGEALDIKSATLEVQGNSLSAQVAQKESCVAFEVDLKQGATYLNAWLSDDNNYYTAACYIDAQFIQWFVCIGFCI